MAIGLSSYYQRYRPVAGYLGLMRNAIGAKTNAERRSWINRANDYLRLARNAERQNVHRELNDVLERQHVEWPHYDYGEGYFYQSLESLGIAGLRSTEARISAYDLLERVNGRTVLDIGCNAGFLAVSLAQTAKSVTGFDINPHLIEAGRIAAQAMLRSNVELTASAFEETTVNERYDVVLSLANHSTYDGQTRYDLQSYFDHCRELVRPSGLFIFESHTPSFEGAGIIEVCKMISLRFEIKQQGVHNYGTYLDRGRTFIVSERIR